MVKEIRIYVEGGGDSQNTKRQIREGFSYFFKDLIQSARSKRIKWAIIPCGSRDTAFRDFMNALEDHPDAFNLLLVDSEGSVPKNCSPRQYLKNTKNWNLDRLDDDQCHLMVQMMEAWFISDIIALRGFYKQDLRENSIPRSPVEEINDPKSILRRATSGKYQEIQHVAKLLSLINVKTVRAASSHCDRLFEALEAIIERME
jgi:hypothetical protein